MEKKPQSLLVIWVGMMLLLIIGIGIAGYVGHTEPSRQLSTTPSVVNGGSVSPTLSYPAAYVTPNRPAVSMGAQSYVAPVALANTNRRLAGSTNEITVSIYEQGNVVGQAQFLGSGVIVTADSVLTDAHIVDNRSNLVVYVYAPQRAVYPVTVFRCDSANDLAVLKTAGDARFVSVGLIGDPNDLAAGDSVFAMGNANGNGNSLMDGVIVDKHFTVSVNGQEFVRMRTNMTMSAGICGGPLVNMQGEVVGVNNSLGHPGTVTSIGKALPLIYSGVQYPTQVV